MVNAMGSGELAYALADKGRIDEYEVYLNPLVRGRGNLHELGDRGTIRMELHDVKRFASGVVLLTYPTSVSHGGQQNPAFENAFHAPGCP